MKYKVHESHNQSLANPPFGLALTGRVGSWLEQPSDRLPVSCTVLSIEDSMEGHSGIEYSWLYASKGLRYGAGVAFDGSKLRAKGVTNEKGLTASGWTSFMKIQSVLNEVIRRGGVYKNGAITVYEDYASPDCPEFISVSTAEYPWIKRAVYVDEGLKNHPIKEALAEAVDKGYVWLAKKQYDQHGERLYSNVCLEILLRSRGTCLLSHINAGLLKPEEFPQAFRESMEYLCNLHKHTGVDDGGFYYLTQEEDRQVGLGVIGLANHLAIEGVTYEEFVNELEALEKATNGYDDELFYAICPCAFPEDRAKTIAYYLVMGFKMATEVAKANNMDRAFTVAPTATSFTKHEDKEGYSVAPEISAPIALEIERASETFGIVEYEFNPNSETAFEVGWDTQWRLLNAWQRLMDSTGLGHSISSNIWSSCKVDEDWIDTFLDSDIKTTYYRLAVSQFSNDKSQILDDETLGKMASAYETEEVEEEPVAFCSFDDIMAQECKACSGS